MFTANSTYYAEKESKELAWQYNKKLLSERDVRKTELQKKTVALTLTTRKLEQATDDVKSVTKEYKDLKRAVKGDFKKVYDLAQSITGKDPKHLWTHSSGRPIPLAASKISKMTSVIDREYARLDDDHRKKCEDNEAYEEMVRKFNTRHSEQKDEIAALTKERDLALEAKQTFKSKFTVEWNNGVSTKEALLKNQTDLINSQREVQRLKDLLVQRVEENKKLSEELDSRFCRFVDTLTGGGRKKRKLNSSSSTALTLLNSKDD